MEILVKFFFMHGVGCVVLAVWLGLYECGHLVEVLWLWPYDGVCFVAVVLSGRKSKFDLVGRQEESR